MIFPSFVSELSAAKDISIQMENACAKIFDTIHSCERRQNGMGIRGMILIVSEISVCAFSFVVYKRSFLFEN